MKTGKWPGTMGNWKWAAAGMGIGIVLMLPVVLWACHGKGARPSEPVATAPLPPETEVAPVQPEPQPEPTQEAAANMLTDDQWNYLATQGWAEGVGESLAVWVSVDEQVTRLIQGREVIWEGPCATASKGTGFVKGSMQTPLGWHAVKRKTGAGAPWGQVFRGGAATEEIWKPGQTTTQDLVLTRVLFLDGLEPGKNKGGNVDSYERCIYIHGTNDEAKIGTPSSHGCIRLRNDDVIGVYDLIPNGTKVLITERQPGA